MPPRVTDRQLASARRLRREMTTAEEMLWRSLRNRGAGAKFRRQVPIGPYIGDFVCVAAKMVVELDGPPHEKPEQRSRDARRDLWLRSQGWHVLRFPNDLVIGGSERVMQAIEAALASRPAPSSDLR